jgi:Uma2 family endonuclease
MNVVVSYTPDDLLRLPDGDHYELVEGRLVEKQMGAKASSVIWNLGRILGNHVVELSLGWVLESDTGYTCFPHSPRTVRKPDLSFIRRGRLDNEELPDGYVKIPPDLAVEVVFPNDTVYELNEKLRDYLDVGVALIWVIDPHNRMVNVYHQAGSRLLRQNDELDGLDVVPGFRCRIADLFWTPVPPNSDS